MFRSQADARAVWDVLKRNHPEIVAKVEGPKPIDTVDDFVADLRGLRGKQGDEAERYAADLISRLRASKEAK